MATAVLAVSAVLQLLATALALRLIVVTRRSLAWSLVAGAIGLMAARRGISLAEALSGGRQPDLAAELVALLISVLMVVGVALVGPIFAALRDSRDALAESDGRHRTLFEHCPVPLIDADWSGARRILAELPGPPPTVEDLLARPELVERCLREVRILAANRAALELFEIDSAEELAGRRATLATSDTGVRTLSAIAHGQHSFHLEASFKTRAGRPRSVIAAWAVPPGCEESFARVFTTVMDTTEHERLEANLMMTDRMSAVGTLAAGVAHEINNPLTYVYGNLQILEADLADDEARAALVADALVGTERVRDIVRDLQSFTRKPGEVGPVAVRPLVESALRMTDHELRHRAQTRCDVPATLQVLGDESRLGQVLLNLLMNAAHAVGSRPGEDNLVVVDARAGNGTVTITVTDTGRGIPEGLVPHVFEPFVTTREPGHGTGLGLYLCLNIVRSLDGSIAVARTGPEGTAVEVTLPRADVDAADAEHEATPGAVVKSRLRVLVVDDDPGVRGVLQRLLAAHDVTVASDGREALAALDAAGFDLILCDLMMPDMTGMEVHAHLASRSPELLERVVFLTGGAFTAEAHAFLASPGRRYVTKPFEPATLRAVVAEVTARPATSA